MIRPALFAMALLLAPLGALASEPTPRVLFVGNSYLHYNGGVDHHLSAMLAAGEVPRAELRAQTISNARLAQHRIDAYLADEADLDLLVLQGHSTAALSEANQASFRAAVTAAAQQARVLGAQVALYRTPAYARGHRLYTDGISDRIDALYASAAAEVGALVIPVGRAFDLALDGRPELLLHVPSDHSHPTLAGTYLAAATVYAAFTGQSPEPLDYTAEGALGEDAARYLRRVAGETVLEAGWAGAPMLVSARGG